MMKKKWLKMKFGKKWYKRSHDCTKRAHCRGPVFCNGYHDVPGPAFVLIPIYYFVEPPRLPPYPSWMKKAVDLVAREEEMWSAIEKARSESQ